jgi:hypothetical protein
MEEGFLFYYLNGGFYINNGGCYLLLSGMTLFLIRFRNNQFRPVCPACFTPIPKLLEAKCLNKKINYNRLQKHFF